MEDSGQSQKEVGQKYRDNLRYFRRLSYIARQKFFLSVFFVLLGCYAIIQLEVSHWDRIYNPAPLSIPHASLERNCAACHDPKARDLTRIFRRDSGDEHAPRAAGVTHRWSAEHALFFSSAASINQACASCHVGMDLHQPTTQTLALADFHKELHVVGANGCFSCHQEHLGRIDLKLPGDSACVACHSNAEQMSANLMRVPLPGKKAPPLAVAIHGMTSDGVVHFIPPERKGPMPLFTAFEKDHPPFEYEQPGLKDPDLLTFSHQQHLVRGMNLKCADCHQPAADGIYYQRVTYEAACQRCHALQLDPNAPGLLLPHGDVGRLRSFLHSLVFQYSEMDRKHGYGGATDDALRATAEKQVYALLQRAQVTSPADFEHEIIFTADPYKDRPPTGQRPFFAGCAYCHQVTQPPGNAEPVVTPPSMADRWLAHGAFTHAKHVTLACESCHNAAGSTAATDLIMPAKESCTSCHRADGNAPSNCLACHSFHSPQTVVQKIRQQWKLEDFIHLDSSAPGSAAAPKSHGTEPGQLDDSLTHWLDHIRVFDASIIGIPTKTDKSLPISIVQGKTASPGTANLRIGSAKLPKAQ